MRVSRGCCSSLKTSSLIIGCVGMVLSIIGLCAAYFQVRFLKEVENELTAEIPRRDEIKVPGYDDPLTAHNIYETGSAVVQLYLPVVLNVSTTFYGATYLTLMSAYVAVIYPLLILGVCLGKPKMLVPWLVVKVISLIGYMVSYFIVILLTSVGLYGQSDSVKAGVMFGVHAIMAGIFCCILYLIVVVNSYRLDLLEKKNLPNKKINLSLVGMENGFKKLEEDKEA